MKKIILLISTLIFSLNVSAAIVVIGNQAGINDISQKNVKKLFMGKKSKLANGDKAKIIELVDGAAGRIAFHEIVTGRSEAQLQSAWARLVFTGKAEAPIQVADDAAMIKAVSASSNAIGYIEESSVTADIKVLLKL
ncbi:Phosphate ABC transporter periplasmic protein [Shewanella benthica]|uniref:Phosphate ABC transporter periplasmic protein n=1 Tax=Shewanella benthica TaxID=43661 RepID=A0A330M1S1_9GAMM|nr:phosphate ABC transporter substrate-binding protein [Shewanella benthica]SQH75000.1 Phosphate ABC transporter periplasmic protein [Shewanella benthica]